MVKGGALLADMRQLVCQWVDDLEGEEAIRAANQILHKSTRVREADTLKVHELGFEQKSLVLHPDWKLFLIGQTTVECHLPSSARPCNGICFSVNWCMPCRSRRGPPLCSPRSLWLENRKKPRS